jgi:hypothetical protein
VSTSGRAGLATDAPTVPPSWIGSALSLLGLSTRVYVVVAFVSWHSSNYDLARCSGRPREVHHTQEHQRLTVFVRSVITLGRAAHARPRKEMMLMPSQFNTAYRVIISLVASSL